MRTYVTRTGKSNKPANFRKTKFIGKIKHTKTFRVNRFKLLNVINYGTTNGSTNSFPLFTLYKVINKIKPLLAKFTTTVYVDSINIDFYGSDKFTSSFCLHERAIGSIDFNFVFSSAQYPTRNTFCFSLKDYFDDNCQSNMFNPKAALPKFNDIRIACQNSVASACVWRSNFKMRYRSEDFIVVKPSGHDFGFWEPLEDEKSRRARRKRKFSNPSFSSTKMTITEDGTVIVIPPANPPRNDVLGNQAA